MSSDRQSLKQFSFSFILLLKVEMSVIFKRQFHASCLNSFEEVLILSAARTPVGKFNGTLKSVTAPQLGSIAISAALKRAGLISAGILKEVNEVYMGNVLQANEGQSPARQAALGAGLPESTEATTINKVCASAMKAIMQASQAIQTHSANVMVAGGMESMSNAPYYLPRSQAYGHFQAVDSIIKDGLWDVYGDIHMGICAENTVKNMSLSREDQDEYAQESYRRAIAAINNGLFTDEIAPVTLKTRKGNSLVIEDEEPKSVSLDRLPTLRPAFHKEGTVTAGNASPINDGASAIVLAAKSYLSHLQSFAVDVPISPIGRIISFADAATTPIDFTIAPSISIPRALERAGLAIADIAQFEINEAFAAVALANRNILGLDLAKVNVKGGAVALGHAIGSSGCRIVVTLLHSLKPGEFGVAAICNGGGGSSAVVVQRL
ncbi:Thiolase, N-terminal domain-containing protein [Lipomyces oligophaga]|uniref:Thiolase, N-terminal domain-containing protein n=1 Tax=Lipomyces oligophaga TaxID=45792 RepID=UPI0034CF8B52